jgi:hypothetical protein
MGMVGSNHTITYRASIHDFVFELLFIHKPTHHPNLAGLNRMVSIQFTLIA